MSTEIAIALISGVVGLSGAIIAWVQSLRTSRISANTESALEKMRSDTSLALEELKSDHERRKRAFEIAIEESRPIESALAQAWHDLQTIKEVLSKYLSGFRFEVGATNESLKSACSSLSEGYSRWGVVAPEEARLAWHKAKGSAASAAFLVRETVEYPLSTDILDRLTETRAAINDSQMVIAAARHTVRDLMMKRILELV